jgi:hypothetical protein
VRARARSTDGGAHLRRLLQQRRGRQVRRRGGRLRRGRGRALRRCGGGVAERLQQRVGVVVVCHRRPRRHLRLHGVVAVMLLLRWRRLHDLLLLVVVVLLERGEVLDLVLHHLRRRRGVEQRVVVRRRCGCHGAEADGLGTLLGERVAEGAVRDEAVPPAACDAKERRESNLYPLLLRGSELDQKQKGKEKAKSKSFPPPVSSHSPAMAMLCCRV